MVYIDTDGRQVTGGGRFLKEEPEKPKALWEPCPRCGSKHVHSSPVFGWGETAMMMFLGLCFMPIFLPLGFSLLLGGPLMFLFFSLSKGECTCQDCKYSWTISKGAEDEEYRS